MNYESGENSDCCDTASMHWCTSALVYWCTSALVHWSAASEKVKSWLRIGSSAQSELKFILIFKNILTLNMWNIE